MAETILQGITWDHPRGYDPMVATAAHYCATHPGVEIHWQKRPLQAFADRPIEEMAGEYDLMVIDHPHVGQVAHSGHLLALNDVGRGGELTVLAAQSVGASHRSYAFGGQQWALAIDAATPVAAFRPDRLETAPDTWDIVLDLARKSSVAFALIPINTLMDFMGMARNLGHDIATNPGQFIARGAAQQVLELLLEIVSLMDPKCLELDPIGVLDWMGKDLDGPVYSPFGYGYTNFSRTGYCRFPLTFTDAPGIGSNTPDGTVLGGTGIAVSATSKHLDIAVDYAFWVASAGCQSGLFFDAGGQPGNAVAWEDARLNAATKDFFTGTRRTLETAWLRPRYDGYMDFQALGGEILHACLRGETGAVATLDHLEHAYRKSRS